MCAENFRSMGGWAECSACADMGARTPKGTSGNYHAKVNKIFPIFLGGWGLLMKNEKFCFFNPSQSLYWDYSQIMTVNFEDISIESDQTNTGALPPSVTLPLHYLIWKYRPVSKVSNFNRVAISTTYKQYFSNISLTSHEHHSNISARSHEHFS